MNEYTVSKEALMKVVNAASLNVNMDEDVRTVIAALRNIYAESEMKTIILSNLAKCESYILWNGEDDVRYLIESGCYQEEMQKLTAEEQEEIIAQTCGEVDWSDVESTGIEAGNQLIENALSEVLCSKQLTQEGERS